MYIYLYFIYNVFMYNYVFMIVVELVVRALQKGTVMIAQICNLFINVNF